MPGARTNSPSFVSVQALADRALDRSDGLDVVFDVATYGSLEATATASRSFQSSFTALRARARRLSMQRLGQSDWRDTQAFGRYDALDIRRLPLAEGNGWVCSLVPVNAALAAMTVIDRATGLPLEDVGKTQSEANALIDWFLSSISHHPNRKPPLTPEQRARWKEINPESYEDMEEQYAAIERKRRGAANPAKDPAFADDSELGGF